MGGAAIGLIRACWDRRLRDAVLTLVLAVAGAAPLGAAAHPCPESPEAAATAVRDALYAGDSPALAALAHDERGIRISPAAYIDPEVDVVLDRDAIRGLWSDHGTHDWGYAEGTGEVITMTGAEFIAAFITDLPFETAEATPHDPDAAPASTTDNAAQVYPDAALVEFTIGEAAEDWAALRMAFVPVDGCLRLVGLIRARWSP